MTGRRSRRGLSTLELLIASSLLGLIGAAITVVFVGTDRAAQQTTDISQAQTRARQAMIQVEREVRAGYGSSLDSTDILNDILTFDTLAPNSTVPVAVSYFVDGNGNLVRQQGANNQVVIDNVASFELPAATADSVTMVLTIDVNGQSAVLSTTVAFRNP